MVLRFLRALFTRRSIEAPPEARVQQEQGFQASAFTTVPGTGRGYFMEIVGESQYQEALRDVWQDTKPEREFDARLTPEPDNPYDANAVAVQSIDGSTLGYLPRAEAARYQQLLLQLTERGDIPVCAARLAGGGRKSFGVWLDVDGPTIVAAKLNLRYTRVKKSRSTEQRANQRAGE